MKHFLIAAALLVSPSASHAKDTSIFAEVKVCMDSLFAVYGKTSNMSDYFYYTPTPPKLVVRGELLGDKVLFNTQPLETFPTSTYVERAGSPVLEAPPSGVWKAIKAEITRALLDLPAHYEKQKAGLPTASYEAAAKECEPFFNSDSRALKKALQASFANRAALTAAEYVFVRQKHLRHATIEKVQDGALPKTIKEKESGPQKENSPSKTKISE